MNYTKIVFVVSAIFLSVVVATQLIGYYDLYFKYGYFVFLPFGGALIFILTRPKIASMVFK